MADLPTNVDAFSRFDGGIADYEKDGLINEYAFGRSIDHRSNPKELTLLPQTSKESGSTITALPKWGERVGNTTYVYDQAGNIYSRSSTATYSLLRSVANSHGNGLAYYGEDDNLYYTSDKVIGRYGYLTGTPTFADDFLGSQGGVPTNTFSLGLLSASSQYATVADSASISITGNIALEIYMNPTSLPAVGSSVTLLGKWDESGTLRSYRFDIFGISGYFGDGSGGALTVSVNTTDAPIDSACSGTSGTTSLTATNASFATGQVIFIHQTRGTGAGTYMRNKIASYTAGTITLDTALTATFTSSGSSCAQVLVLKQYTSVTVNSGITWTAKAWNGTVGGILAFLASGTVTVTGNINANSTGFRGGSGKNNLQSGDAGEGTAGATVTQTSANGNGGGGASGGDQSGGGGGGNASAGTAGSFSNGTVGAGGSSVGTSDLTTMDLGGGGGGGGTASTTEGNSGTGGVGGGIIFISAVTIIVSGSVTASGAVGGNAGGAGKNGGGGGGAGGSILFKAQVVTFGSSLVAALGGAGGSGNGIGVSGGTASVGRIHLDYLTSYTGSTNPTIDATQDQTLVTSTSYQLRFSVSNDGTAVESLTRTILSGITLAAWHHCAVSWVASTSTATFYFDKLNIGTAVGSKTAIHDNASLLYVGAHKGASAVGNFFNGLIDEPRIWNTSRTDSQISSNADRELVGNESGLVFYGKLNNSASDTTANANNMTLVNSPAYNISVPFFNATTRVDIDQQDTSTGNTYTVPVAIDEGATARQTFVPTKDPQKSMDVKIAGRGSGNWTLTIHDALNRVIATVTVSNATLPTSGYYEFLFSPVWRPVRGASYHFHITSTVADGTVTTGTASNLETVNYNSYFQFLVADTEYHPLTQFINMLAVGNERYLGTWDASSYNPHRLTFPSGYRVRCFAQWREYLAIGCTRGSNIYDYDDGIIFFWDGYSTTYNFYIKVPEGGVNAMLASRGVLYVYAGYQGDMLTYIGGDSADQVKRVPKMLPSNYIEVMPGAVNMWQSLLRFGVAGASDSTVVERGVYTYGQRNSTRPKALTYDYPISTGSRLSTVQIGMLLAIDRKLLVGWKDGNAYGVDVVDPAGTPFATGTVELRIQDYGAVYHEKSARTVRADFKPLRTGESITPKYKLDRSDNWVLGDTISTVGEVKARVEIPKGNYREIQVAADLAQTGGTSPTLLELTNESDLKKSDLIV